MSITIPPVEVGRPLTRGPLALFPLYADTPPANTYVSGPVAVASGLLSVSEREGRAVVPELVVTVEGARPVLLVEGETLLGARQHRTLNTSVLCAPGRTVVPVSCVEAGRWGGGTTATRSDRLAPAGLRARKTASVAASVNAGRGRTGDQADVWAAVEDYSRRAGSHSPTRSLEDAQVQRARDVRRLVGDVRPLPAQRGLAVAVAGRVRAVDLFDDAATLAAYWDALLAGATLDAVGLPRPPRHPGRSRVHELLDLVRAAPATRSAGVGLGVTEHVVTRVASAAALVVDGSLIHVAAFALAATAEPPPVHPIRRGVSEA